MEEEKFNKFVRGMRNIEVIVKYAMKGEQDLKEVSGKIRKARYKDYIILKNYFKKIVIPFAGSNEGIFSIEAFGVELYKNKGVLNHYFAGSELSLEQKTQLLSQGKYLQ